MLRLSRCQVSSLTYSETLLRFVWRGVGKVRKMSDDGRIVPSRGGLNDEAVAGKGPQELEDVDPSIIYLDEHYCVIDKPPGVRMDGNFPVTIEKLVAKWTNRGIKDIKWMHQLDFATSGALCIGLSREAVSAVVSSFEHRSVRKAYLAVLQGHLKVEDWPLLTTSAASTLAEEVIPDSFNAGITDALTTVVVEKHRKALVATNKKQLKRKLAELQNPDSSLSANGSSSIVTITPSTWQDQVMNENLTKSLEAFRQIDISQHSSQQDEHTALAKYTFADFVKGPKLRKQLRKHLLKCGIAVDFVKSSEESAGTLPNAEPTSNVAVAPSDAPSRSPSPSATKPLTEAEIDLLCAQYRDPSLQPKGVPAIYRLPTPTNAFRPDIVDFGTQASSSGPPTADVALRDLMAHYTESSVGATGKVQEHLLVDIPVAELDDDFRMEPGHPRNPGKKAVTEVFVLAHGYFCGQPVTKVLFKPISGRRHQLRIHALCLGHPILGDYTYNAVQRQNILARLQFQQKTSAPMIADTTTDGEPMDSTPTPVVAPRMMLHAYCIHIPFPQSGRCPLPFKRNILLRQKQRQWLRESGGGDGADVMSRKQEIEQQMVSLSNEALRDAVITDPLLDLATPVDPFPLVHGGELRPNLPRYMLNKASHSASVNSS